MNIHVVRTPTDMRSAINDACRVNFLAIPEAMEPEVRHAWEGIYENFIYMEPNDEPGLIASYLESIEEPLADLRALGMQVIYLTSRGTMGDTPMRMTDFLIAPTPCYFRAEGSGLVHLLGAQCDQGHRTFLTEGSAVRLWLSSEEVEQSFEHSGPPWCPTCSMAGAPNMAHDDESRAEEYERALSVLLGWLGSRVAVRVVESKVPYGPPAPVVARMIGVLQRGEALDEAWREELRADDEVEDQGRFFTVGDDNNGFFIPRRLFRSALQLDTGVLWIQFVNTVIDVRKIEDPG